MRRRHPGGPAAGALLLGIAALGATAAASGQVVTAVIPIDAGPVLDATTEPYEMVPFDNFDPSLPPGIDITPVVPTGLAATTVDPAAIAELPGAAVAGYAGPDDQAIALLAAAVNSGLIDGFADAARAWALDPSAEPPVLTDEMQAALVDGLELPGDFGAQFAALPPEQRREVLMAVFELVDGGPVAPAGWLRDSTQAPFATGGSLACGGEGVLCGDQTDPTIFEAGYHAFRFQLPEPATTMPEPYEVEIIVTLLGDGVEPYLSTQFPGDLFNYADTAVVIAWDGTTASIRQQSWQNGGWPDVTTGVRGVIDGNTVTIYVPRSGFVAARMGTFLAGGARQPGTVGSVTYPAIIDPLAPLTELATPLEPGGLVVLAQPDPAMLPTPSPAVTPGELSPTPEPPVTPDPNATSIPLPAVTATERPFTTPVGPLDESAAGPGAGGSGGDGFPWEIPTFGGAAAVVVGTYMTLRTRNKAGDEPAANPWGDEPAANPLGDEPEGGADR